MQSTRIATDVKLPTIKPIVRGINKALWKLWLGMSRNDCWIFMRLLTTGLSDVGSMVCLRRDPGVLCNPKSFDALGTP
jgi:hypothetical protein